MTSVFEHESSFLTFGNRICEYIYNQSPLPLWPFISQSIFRLPSLIHTMGWTFEPWWLYYIWLKCVFVRVYICMLNLLRQMCGIWSHCDLCHFVPVLFDEYSSTRWRMNNTLCFPRSLSVPCLIWEQRLKSRHLTFSFKLCWRLPFIPSCVFPAALGDVSVTSAVFIRHSVCWC